MAADETTQSNVEPSQDGTGIKSVERRTPLPKWQLFSVYLIQLAEPITALCIYPFVNQFVRETGITGGDEKKTGYYGGIIESTFFLSEALTVVIWGYLSDRFGRRPILLIAPLGLAASMLSFGLSTTFLSLVISRGFQGMFNGNIGVSKTVIAELTDSTNRGEAFSFISLVWSIGFTTAPLIGGVLSNPAQRWPDGIGRIPLLKLHPYFLPCAVAAAVAIAGFLTGYFVLKETLPSLVAKRAQEQRLETVSNDTEIATEESPLIRRRNGSPSSSEQLSSTNTQVDLTQSSESPIAKTPRFKDAFIRPIITTALCAGLLAFIDMCQVALLPLMWSTPIALGGLGLEPFRIGLVLGTVGFCNAFILINFAGRILRRFGARTVFRVSISSVSICYAMYPIIKYFVQQSGRIDGFVMTLLFVQMFCHGPFISFAYISVQILVVDSVPPGGPLGTATGLAQLASSSARTLAPSLATSLFAYTLQTGLAGGNLVYYIFFAVGLLSIYATSFLPKKAQEESRAQ